MPKHLLLVGDAEPVPEPSWSMVAAAASEVNRHRSVILRKLDGRHIRADGARLVHTIVFYETAEAPPLVVGRPEGGQRRGKATLDGDHVIVSSLEHWGSDGVEVFRAFFNDEPLNAQFTLRNPATPCSASEIRAAIGARQ
jgi:hypothetical protein